MSEIDAGPDLKQQLADCQTRERRVMELLKTTSPDRIEHDLRNVLNELNLLRMLFEQSEAKQR